MGSPVVSFTFDNASQGALAYGGAILERYGTRGTYYLSADANRAARTHKLDAATLRGIHASGHEVGCHVAAVRNLGAQIDRNLAEIQSVLPNVGIEHFAYPPGRVTRESRRLVAARFQTGRSLHQGINRGRVDSAALRANKLYGPAEIYRQAIVLIHDVASRGGWLIFSTQDVSPSPGPSGAHALAFEHVVRVAADAGCLLQPIGVAARSLVARPGSTHPSRDGFPKGRTPE
jgi:peptidoglycan/xylan/chitin deacetylase (PgdA/CDA1 family)